MLALLLIDLLSSFLLLHAVFAMIRQSITSPRLARQLLFGGSRHIDWRATGQEIQLSSSSLTSSSPLRAKALPRPSYLPLTGNDLRKNRPARNTKFIWAYVQRQKRERRERERLDCERREDSVSKGRSAISSVWFIGDVRPAVEHFSAPLPRRLPGPGILKNTALPPKAHARHVSFGETSVKVVDRWMERRWRRPVYHPFPPPSHALFPAPGSRPLLTSSPSSPVPSSPAPPPPVTSVVVASTENVPLPKPSNQSTSPLTWLVAIGCAAGYVYLAMLLQRLGLC